MFVTMYFFNLLISDWVFLLSNHFMIYKLRFFFFFIFYYYSSFFVPHSAVEEVLVVASIVSTSQIRIPCFSMAYFIPAK